jgi:hypothetical protein
MKRFEVDEPAPSKTLSPANYKKATGFNNIAEWAASVKK